MSALNDDLSDFARAIVQGCAPSSRIDAGYAHYFAEVAIEIYRNNYRGNLHDALAGAYPVTEKLVGQPFFRLITREYIGKYGSKSGNLHQYGKEMAAFLASFDPAQCLPYLPDVARLEWACHRAYFAEDAASLNLDDLSKISADRYADLILYIHPACRLLRSIYPISAIWHANQSGIEGDVDLDAGGSNALVCRLDNVVSVNELTEADAAWLQGVQAGLQLGSVTDATQERYPDFDLQTLLQNLMSKNVLMNFKLKEIA